MAATSVYATFSCSLAGFLTGMNVTINPQKIRNAHRLGGFVGRVLKGMVASTHDGATSARAARTLDAAMKASHAKALNRQPSDSCNAFKRFRL